MVLQKSEIVEVTTVFYRLELIAAYGTGILKIMGGIFRNGKTPKIETSGNNLFT